MLHYSVVRKANGTVTHIFAVGDMVRIVKTQPKQITSKSYCKTTAGAPPTKDLQPAADLMGLGDDILDTLELHLHYPMLLAM